MQDAVVWHAFLEFDHGGGFNFDQRFIFYQTCNHNHCNRGKSITQNFAIHIANLLLIGCIITFVGDIPCQAGQILCGSASGLEHGANVQQRLLHLADKFIGRKILFGVPANLSRNMKCGAGG